VFREKVNIEIAVMKSLSPLVRDSAYLQMAQLV
jgi:hypothetical protein